MLKVNYGVIASLRELTGVNAATPLRELMDISHSPPGDNRGFPIFGPGSIPPPGDNTGLQFSIAKVRPFSSPHNTTSTANCLPQSWYLPTNRSCFSRVRANIKIYCSLIKNMRSAAVIARLNIYKEFSRLKICKQIFENSYTSF